VVCFAGVIVARKLLMGCCALALGGCHASSSDADEVPTASLADGTYHVIDIVGSVQPGEEANLLAMSARLNRAAGTLVLTLADGTQRTLTFAPRRRSSWRSDCFTMASHIDNEVADLSPAPLALGSLTFASPVAYPKCSEGRILLSAEPDEVPPLIVLDRDG
jgi:hypothetical protein